MEANTSPNSRSRMPSGGSSTARSTWVGQGDMVAPCRHAAALSACRPVPAARRARSPSPSGAPHFHPVLAGHQVEGCCQEDWALKVDRGAGRLGQPPHVARLPGRQRLERGPLKPPAAELGAQVGRSGFAAQAERFDQCGASRGKDLVRHAAQAHEERCVGGSDAQHAAGQVNADRNLAQLALHADGSRQLTKPVAGWKPERPEAGGRIADRTCPNPPVPSLAVARRRNSAALASTSFVRPPKWEEARLTMKRTSAMPAFRSVDSWQEGRNPARAEVCSAGAASGSDRGQRTNHYSATTRAV